MFLPRTYCNFPAISGSKICRKWTNENPALNVSFSESGHLPHPVGGGTCGVRDWAGPPPPLPEGGQRRDLAPLGANPACAAMSRGDYARSERSMDRFQAPQVDSETFKKIGENAPDCRKGRVSPFIEFEHVKLET